MYYVITAQQAGSIIDSDETYGKDRAMRLWQARLDQWRDGVDGITGTVLLALDTEDGRPIKSATVNL